MARGTKLSSFHHKTRRLAQQQQQQNGNAVAESPSDLEEDSSDHGDGFGATSDESFSDEGIDEEAVYNLSEDEDTDAEGEDEESDEGEDELDDEEGEEEDYWAKEIAKGTKLGKRKCYCYFDLVVADEEDRVSIAFGAFDFILLNIED